ncbi:MAG TPA: DUF2087 domain-containing protein [Acidimicrobiia bacterium]
MSETVTVAEFTDRLAALCTGGALLGFPRRQRDVAILLASATMWMELGAVYTEREVNEGLGEWLGSICPSLRLDAVTLRRELVDRVYLDRDDAGRHYSLGTGPRDIQFDEAVAAVDNAAVTAGAIEERKARKAAHMAGEGT